MMEAFRAELRGKIRKESNGDGDGGPAGGYVAATVAGLLAVRSVVISVHYSDFAKRLRVEVTAWPA